MNRNFSTKAIQRVFWTGAMILSAVAASASTIVTFQVDMTEQVTGGSFVPGTGAVSVSGTFNGWGEFGLTNNSGAPNPNLYTGIANDTSDANGNVVIYKYVTNGTAYESTQDSDNRCAQLPAAGGSLVLPVSFYDDAGPSASVNVTFQVNMAEQMNLGTFDTNTGDYVEVHGFFNGWGSGDVLTNDTSILTTNSVGIVTSNVYIGTFEITGATNGTEEYKYVIQPAGAYEGPLAFDSDFDNGNNRFFIVTPSTLPIVSFSDEPLAESVTNNVTFEIDMTTQIEAGAFTSANTVEIHGDFNNWGGGQQMTNDPTGPTPDIYNTEIQYVGTPGTQHYFKYVIQPGTEWENVSAANQIGGNRWFDISDTSSNFVVGPVYYSDEPPSALVDFVTVTNCEVTFTVQMTNAVGTDGTVFDNAYPSGDQIYINGLNGGLNNTFWGWDTPPAGYEMTQITNSTLFTITLPVNRGQNDQLIYKYSINGYDNEAGFADNHNRWIRSLPDYTMPVDIFDSQGETNQIEGPAGDLTIAAAAAGTQVELNWIGRRGVLLQTATSLDPSAVWTPLYLTDGTNLIVAPGGAASTNYTIGAGDLYYRLVGPK
jgi:hypothetical protein